VLETFCVSLTNSMFCEAAEPNNSAKVQTFFEAIYEANFKTIQMLTFAVFLNYSQKLLQITIVLLLNKIL